MNGLDRGDEGESLGDWRLDGFTIATGLPELLETWMIAGYFYLCGGGT